MLWTAILKAAASILCLENKHFFPPEMIGKWYQLQTATSHSLRYTVDWIKDQNPNYQVKRKDYWFPGRVPPHPLAPMKTLYSEAEEEEKKSFRNMKRNILCWHRIWSFLAKEKRFRIYFPLLLQSRIIIILSFRRSQCQNRFAFFLKKSSLPFLRPRKVLKIP